MLSAGYNEEDIKEVFNKKGGTKKVAVVSILVVVLLALVGGGFWYFGSPDTVNQETETVVQEVVFQDEVIVEDEISDLAVETVATKTVKTSADNEKVEDVDQVELKVKSDKPAVEPIDHRAELEVCDQKSDYKNEKGICYIELAAKYNDGKFCSLLEGAGFDKWLGAHCYSWMASKYRNHTACSFIDDEYDKTSCLARDEWVYDQEKFSFCLNSITQQARDMCGAK